MSTSGFHSSHVIHTHEHIYTHNTPIPFSPPPMFAEAYGLHTVLEGPGVVQPLSGGPLCSAELCLITP